MVHVGYEGDGRRFTQASPRPVQVGDDVAELVVDEAHLRLGKDVPHLSGDSLLIKGDGRLAAQPGKNAQSMVLVCVHVYFS